jgi:periplasmic divalent cation tolerance protein
MSAEFLLVLCTCPTRSVASAITTALLEQELAACVNRLPGIKSSYRWKGQVEEDDELLLMIKTTSARLPEVEQTIGKLHPYELPEVVGVPITAGSEPYLDWIRRSTT